LYFQSLNSTLELIIRERGTLVSRARHTNTHPVYIPVAMQVTWIKIIIRMDKKKAEKHSIKITTGS
jgi:hypothetical protein